MIKLPFDPIETFKKFAAWRNERSERRDPTLYPVSGHIYTIKDKEKFIEVVNVLKARKAIKDNVAFNQKIDDDTEVVCTHRASGKPFFAILSKTTSEEHGAWQKIELSHYPAQRSLEQMGLSPTPDAEVIPNNILRGYIKAAKLNLGQPVLANS